MRLTVEDCNSSDLDKARLANSCEIYLDGVQQQLVTIADEENGYIEKYKWSQSIVGDKLAREVLHGKVEIRRVP